MMNQTDPARSPLVPNLATRAKCHIMRHAYRGAISLPSLRSENRCERMWITQHASQDVTEINDMTLRNRGTTPTPPQSQGLKKSAPKI
eukprot:4823675-Amphidinium_carterae.1